ncbi:MAG: HEAT repeat domain-containing protein [Phycisphaerales bacterium]
MLMAAGLTAAVAGGLDGVGVSVVAPAFGQTGADQPERQERARLVDMLNDWIHYSRINRTDLANDFAKALMEAGLSDEQFAALVEDWAKRERDFESVVISSQKNKDLEENAGKLYAKYTAGKLAAARNAGEISRNIGLLTKSLRERDYGRQRLLAAREYAMPQLLQAFLDQTDPVRQSEVRQVLISLGRFATIPLCTALAGLDPSSQETIVSVLGDATAQYYTAVPYLAELRLATKSEAVRGACDRAIGRLGSGASASDEASVSAAFVELANGYYAESRSLTSFPDEEYQLLWAFNPGVGLVPTPVKTEVFHEAMAMRLCEKALGHEKSNGNALSLWLASNFSREIDTPGGYENPVYPASRRDATYFAVAAGATASEQVLARALDTKDTPLARRAIAAIERTAGDSGLWGDGGSSSRRPLLEALSYPNRRVQYEAALALGAAQPRTGFEGSDRVVPLLASAIRNASDRFAIVIADNPADQGPIKTALEGKGFTVLSPARSFRDIEQELAEAPGIDLIVAVLPKESTESLISEAHGRVNLSATPVLAQVAAPGYFELDKKYSGDARVKVVREGLRQDEVATAAEQLLESAVGEKVSPDEASDYNRRSLAVLRDLAVSNNDVLKVSDASGPLMSALQDSDGPTMLAVAEVLSYIPSKSVQVALMDAAMGTLEEAELVGLLGRVADSAKRFGNLLEPRQVSAVVKMAMGEGSNAKATAAASLMGALKLPNEDLIPLIIQSDAK